MRLIKPFHEYELVLLNSTTIIWSQNLIMFRIFMLLLCLFKICLNHLDVFWKYFENEIFSCDQISIIIYTCFNSLHIDIYLFWPWFNFNKPLDYLIDTNLTNDVKAILYDVKPLLYFFLWTTFYIVLNFCMQGTSLELRNILKRTFRFITDTVFHNIQTRFEAMVIMIKNGRKKVKSGSRMFIPFIESVDFNMNDLKNWNHKNKKKIEIPTFPQCSLEYGY